MLFLTRMLMRSRHMASPTIVLITDRTDLDDQLSAPTLCPVYWANRTDIKAELQMDLILILADHDYPPVPQDDVFKEIFEQAENFKKYEKAECEDKADDSEELARQFSLITAYTVSEASEATIDSKASTDRRPAKKVVEIRLKPVNSVLDDVEKDDDVRRLIHNMMELEDGTTIETIYLEYIREYQEKYFSMKPNDWRHLVGNYVRGVTKRPELKEDTLFYYKVS